MIKVLGGSAASSRMLQVRGPMMVRGDYADGAMKVGVRQKDMQIIAEFARELECPTPLFAATTAIYNAAMAQGFAEADTASVCAVLERLAQTHRRAPLPPGAVGADRRIALAAGPRRRAAWPMPRPSSPKSLASCPNARTASQSSHPGPGSSWAMYMSAARRMPAKPPAQKATTTTPPRSQRLPPMRRPSQGCARHHPLYVGGAFPSDLLLSTCLHAKRVPDHRRYISH
jgi:NAD-binding of NADP-dependent 3-hydroxyisobutyrate dehydrogenase